MEVIVNIQADKLASSIHELAVALQGMQLPAAQNPSVPQQVPVDPLSTTKSVVESSPPVRSTLPTVVPPTHTFDDLASVASSLMDAGKHQQLTGLLHQFKVSALSQLPKERYREFIIALREMGAQI